MKDGTYTITLEHADAGTKVGVGGKSGVKFEATLGGLDQLTDALVAILKHETDKTIRQQAQPNSMQQVIQCLVDDMRQRLAGEHNDFPLDEFRKMYSRVGFLRELGTIRVSGSRRSGHTTAAIQVAGKGHTLYLAPYKNITADLAKQMHGEQFQLRTGGTSLKALPFAFHGVSDLDCIIVDCATIALADKAVLDELYVYAARALKETGFLLLVG